MLGFAPRSLALVNLAEDHCQTSGHWQTLTGTIVVDMLLFLTLLSALYLHPLLALDLAGFQSTVLADERVWLVEFYSTMCGSCKEFSGIWGQIETHFSNIATMKISIDSADGLKIAEVMGALEEGIPSVQLYMKRSTSNEAHKGVTVVSGDVVPFAELVQLVHSHTGAPKLPIYRYLS